jgi:hypothetical protein
MSLARGWDVACPPATAVTVVPTGPVSRGAFVTLSVPVTSTDTFGPSGSTAGTVEFKDGTQVFPATDVLWSDRTIVFRVPQLPSTAASKSWDVYIQEQSASSACGPYPVTVDAGPAAATCPSSERVADGVTGSANQPGSFSPPLTSPFAPGTKWQSSDPRSSRWLNRRGLTGHKSRADCSISL